MSEFQSQSEKISHEKENWLASLKRQKLPLTLVGAIDNEPENSSQILESIDRNLSQNNQLTGYFEHYYSIQEEARIGAKTFAKESGLSDAEGQRNWKTIHDRIMSERDSDYTREIQSGLEKSNVEIAIIWTGGGHVRPVSEGLHIPQDECIVISNQNPQKIGGLAPTNFTVDPETKGVVIPSSIEEKLQEIATFKELRNSLEQESELRKPKIALITPERLEVLQNQSEKETDGRFAKRFSGDKKAKEFENVGSGSKKSWVDRLSNPNQSRDDSVIKR